MPEANLAQIEFFHSKFDGSFEDMQADLGERFLDGWRMSLGGVRDFNPGIKTTVRLYDYSFKLTDIAFEAERFDGKHELLLERIQAPLYLSGWRAKLINWQSKRIARNQIRIRKDGLAASQKAVRTAIEKSRKVVVERYDRRRSFTLLQPDETHELIEKVAHATSVWLFIFRPNDLMSQDNEIVVKLM